MKKINFYLLLLLPIFLGGCGAMKMFESPPQPSLDTISKYIEVKSRESVREEHAKLPVAKPPTPAPPSVSLSLQTSAWVNPDAMQNSAPVRVWVFELSKFEKFGKADVEALITAPEKTLGADLLRSRDLVLAPEELVSLKWAVQQAGFIGIVADFRKPSTQQVQQRQIIAFDAKSALSWKVVFTGNTLITVANAGPDKASIAIDNDIAPASGQLNQ